MPAVGVITPESSFKVVVLPAPFGPKKATNSPCSTVRSIPRTASTARYSRRKSPVIAEVKALPFLVNAVGFRQALNFNRCHDAVIIDPIPSGGKWCKSTNAP